MPVQQALRYLQKAFGNFFAKRTKYPIFKSKHDRQADEYTKSAFSWNSKALKLAKMVEPLLIRWSRTLPKASKLTTVTVSKDGADRYFLSLLCDDVVTPKPGVSAKVSIIDLGLTHFTILSTGEKGAAPSTFRKNELQLSLLQRRLAKKIRGSANSLKARLKVA